MSDSANVIYETNINRDASRRDDGRRRRHVAGAARQRPNHVFDDDRRQLRCEDDVAERTMTTGTSGSPHFDGNLTVDLRTLDTGIGLRNDHLRDHYLEVDKGPGFDKAILSEIVLQG